MRISLSTYALLIIIISLIPIPTYSQVFKIAETKGEWREISDTYIASDRDVGESLIRLYADGYRFGSWIVSIDLNLDVEAGGEIYGYIKIEIPELGLLVQYEERYINRGLFGRDYIENNLTMLLNGERLIERHDYAEEPMNSRLNTRFYLVLMKVIDKLILEFRDDYNNPNSLKSIYVHRELNYNDEPVTFIIELYKNSYDRPGSITAPLYINLPKDLVSSETFQYQTLDYSAGAIFFLSLSFLLGAISFNLVSTKFRIMKEEKLLTTKEGKRPKKRKR